MQRNKNKNYRGLVARRQWNAKKKKSELRILYPVKKFAKIKKKIHLIKQPRIAKTILKK